MKESGAILALHLRTLRLRRALRRHSLAAAHNQAVFDALLCLKVGITGAEKEVAGDSVRLLTGLGINAACAGSAAEDGFDRLYGPGGDPLPEDGSAAGWLRHLTAFCDRMARDRRGEERRIGSLKSELAELELECAAARLESERYDRLMVRLFAEPLPPPPHLAWLIRSGIMARSLSRELMGDRPLDAIPPRLLDQIRRELARFRDEFAASGAKPEPQWHPSRAFAAAEGIFRRGGWRAALLRRVVLWLDRGFSGTEKSAR